MYGLRMNFSDLQVPLDLTRQPEVNNQQPQQPAPVEQPLKPNPVEQPKAPAPVAAQPAAAPPPQAKPAGWAAIAATNTAPAPGDPTNSAPEPPTDSFTSIGEWNQVKYLTFEVIP